MTEFKMKKHVARALDEYYLEHWGENMFDLWDGDPDEYSWCFTRGTQTVTLKYDPCIKEVIETVVE